MSGWRIEVLDKATWHDWREGVRGRDKQLAKIIERSAVPMMFDQYPSGKRYFQWICPGCGGGNYGEIGDEPVSGWDEPRWTVHGLPDGVTLTPSLGCPQWRAGECIGHWWAREGELVLA